LFVNHWTSVNAAGTPLVLQTGVTLAQFQSKVDALRQQRAAVSHREYGRVVLVAERDALRAQTRDMMDNWRRSALYKLAGNALVADLPTLPQENAASSDLLQRFETASSRWEMMNAATAVPNFTPPLLGRDGLTREQFDTQVAEFRSKIQALDALDDGLPILRQQRDNAAREVKDIFGEYRRAILALYAENSPFVQTLPTINAPSTGTTPAPVVLSVTVDTVNHTAQASWTASEAPNLARYSFRISAGPRYKSDDEAVIGDLNPDVRQFSVPAHYLPAGSTVWGKVYVVTEEGREKGSNAEKLTA
jgi:hypothetical protein